MNDSDNILQVRNLSIGFQTDEGFIKVVDNISFIVRKGETIGIVGESGSGKSVTCLSLMRLIPDPQGKIISGEIIFQKHDGSTVDLLHVGEPEIRAIRGKDIAMIFQEPMTSLNPVLTCGQQVMEAIRIHYNYILRNDAKERTIGLLKKVMLPDPETIFNSYPHQISGGQKQRVLIAMAISCNPTVLIADEPTTSLDVTVQATILELLRKLQIENGMSLIFISHDLSVIAEIANRVFVMHKGQFVEKGNVNELFHNPVHPYTKGLLACRPPLKKRLSKLPVVSNFMSVNEIGEFQEISQSINEIQESFVITREQELIHRRNLYETEPVLKVESLNTWFRLPTGVFGKNKFLKAVNNVSFDVYPGETLGLVGESGCGKTTLGRSIVRLIEPHSGKVIFHNKNMASLNKDEMRIIRKKLQLIFQDPYSSLNPRMTIGEAILEPMEVHGLHNDENSRKRKVYELLERVNLNVKHFGRYPHEFSGGERQRVAIARALAVEPEFIICDESVSALDVSVQAQVLNLLNDLKKEFSLSYIFISHDLNVAKFMSDRMMVMNNGRIEELGNVEDIYNNPSTEYTRRLIAAIPKGL